MNATHGAICVVIILNAIKVYGQLYLDNQGQNYIRSQDNFEKELCRERWHRLDWEYILRPCLGRTKFGSNMLPSSLATDPIMSRVINMEIQKAGEYSKFTIQTVDQFGLIKTLGGDTWRVLITGPSSLQPVVHDMGNGVYEVPFLIIEPGLYTAHVFLEGTLCSQYVDPPSDWFIKGDYNGHFQGAHMYSKQKGWPFMLRKRMWERIGGNSTIVQFQIFPRDELRYQANMAKLHDWEIVCKIPATCNFVWDGFGRWVGYQWKPYDEMEGMVDKPDRKDISKTKERRKEKELLFYGDCFAHHFYEMEWNKTLCQSIFKKCQEKYNWVYPRLNPIHELDPSIHRKDSSDISVDKIILYLETALKKTKGYEDSAAIVNYGLHLARSTSFDNYKKLITEVINVFKKYEGEAIWRTTTSVWQQQRKEHKRFQTNQRIQLFNAFAVSAMCSSGIPILDVFPMTASVLYQPQDGIHYENVFLKPLENVLMNYFIEND